MPAPPKPHFAQPHNFLARLASIQDRQMAWVYVSIGRTIAVTVRPCVFDSTVHVRIQIHSSIVREDRFYLRGDTWLSILRVRLFRTIPRLPRRVVLLGVSAHHNRQEA